MSKKALLASLILAVCVLIFGCGQTATVITSTNQASGLTIRGTIRYYLLNNDWWVLGDPVAGAYVQLDGNGQTWTTVANANGEYNFNNIPDGAYQLSATAEGSLYGSPIATVTLKPAGSVPSDNTTVTRDFFFFRFAVTKSYSPESGSIISVNEPITVNFNAPMDTSTVRFSLVPQGLRSLADSGDTVQVDLAWATDNRSVVVTPLGNLLPNQNYRLMMTYVSYTLPNSVPLDAQGGKYISGDGFSGAPYNDMLPHYADYKTVAGGVPSAPGNLQVVVNGKTTSEINIADVLTAANTVKLNWSPSTSGNISGYKIYVARAGSVLNYAPLENDVATTNISILPYFNSDINKVLKALYENGAQVDPIGTKNYPFVNQTVYFKVVAFNGDGESAGCETSAKDAVGPTLNIWSSGWPYAGAVLPNDYYLRPIGAAETNRAYVIINEPVDIATLVPGNFTLTGGLTVQQINHLTSCASPGLFTGTYFEIVASGALAGQTMTMEVGVKDLAGNPVVAGTGDTKTF
jgi:hypothetical protein